MVGTPLLRIDRAMVRFLSNNPKLNSVAHISIVTLNRYPTPVPRPGYWIRVQKTNDFDTR